MSEVIHRQSTRQVRGRIWKTLGRNILLLILALLLSFLPWLLAGWLDGTAEEYRAQVEQERTELLQMKEETPAEDLPEEYHDLVMDAYVREGQLEWDASRRELIATLLRIGAGVLATYFVAKGLSYRK